MAKRIVAPLTPPHHTGIKQHTFKRKRKKMQECQNTQCETMCKDNGNELWWLNLKCARMLMLLFEQIKKLMTTHLASRILCDSN